MSTSGTVIPHSGWGCQSPKHHEIHCFKWEFCVRFAWFCQKHNLGVKWDLLAFQVKNFVMCWETFSENETCSELGSQYFQTVLWNKTGQTGGEKKTKFPIDAGSEGHNACMTCCDQGHNKKYSLEYTNDWMKYGLSFYAMEYSKTSESVKYPVAQNTLHTLSIISYRISSASHCSLRTRIRHMHINPNLFSTVSRQ